MVYRLECRPHDDKRGEENIGVHFAHSQRPARDPSVLWFCFRQRVRVEHDDETGNGETGVQKP